MDARERPTSWADWHRFACDELEYADDEAVEYANARFVEELNRARLRRDREKAPAARPWPGQPARFGR